MEKWTKHRTLALQDPIVSQEDKEVNLKPLEERFGMTCNVSEQVFKDKCAVPKLFTSIKSAVMNESKESVQLLRQILFRQQK